MKKQTILLPLLTSLLLLGCNSTNTASKTDSLEADKTVDVKFNISKASKNEINPFIYGTFIEHIESCIYDGIWSEIIMDRKFMTPVEEDVSQWMITKGDVSMDTETPFEGEYSCILKNGAEIKQMGLTVDDREYSGYVNAKGHGTLTIALKDGANNVSTTVSVNSGSYGKLTFNLKNTFTSKKCQIFFSASGGDVTIDSLSLMPADNYHGMRKDTLEVLKELNSPFYRWPGGNFVSGYDFYDGIGNRDLRPTKRNINYTMIRNGKLITFTDDKDRLANDIMCIGELGFYGAFDSNDFGIEEFIDMCRYINAEPNIVVNSGYGGSQMAADEVEFCNGSSSSAYGSKRLQSTTPYDIKIWSIGNEMNGSWQLGHVPLNEYTKRHNEFAKAMKAVDPDIEIITVGDNSSSWTQGMIDECAKNTTYISEHWYAEQHRYDVKDHILSLKNQTKGRIANHRNVRGIGNITMAIDEYAYAEADCASRLKDGMGVASALNTMIENSDAVSIACYSSTVNATQGNMITDHLNAYMEGSGYAISLYRNNMQNHYIPMTYRAATGDDYYEVSATINDAKDEISVSVINPTDQSLLIKNDAFKKCYHMDYVQGDFLDGFNNAERNELHRHTKEINSVGGFVVEPSTLTVVKIKI